MKARAPEEPLAVLLVDDLPDHREVYGRVLAGAGHRVETASNGWEALVKAAELQPDVVVMDLALPGLDGCEATLRLKRDALTRHIPVVVLTAQAYPEAREKAAAAGCDGYLMKPSDPATLAAEVRRVSRRPAPERA